MAYPDTLDSFTNPLATDPRVGHATLHGAVNDAVEALQAKVGTGTGVAASATDGYVLTADGAGGSAWEAAAGGGTPGVDYPTKATVTLSSAQLLDLHNTPVQLVAAPGAGKWVVVHKVVPVYKYGTAAYATDGSQAPVLGYDGDQSLGGLMENITGSADVAEVRTPNYEGGIPENEPVTAATDGAIFTDGDGTIPLVVWYTVEDVP